MNYHSIVHQEEKPFKSHWNENITDEQYHADNTFVGSTSVRKMIKSPAAFHAAFFGGSADKETDSMKFGTLVHMAMLQGSKFKERYVVMPEFTGLTLKGEVSANSKEAKQKRELWVSELPPGTLVCTQDQYNDTIGMIESVLSHGRASALIKNGKPEIAGFYVDPITKLRCKIKPDFLSFNLGVNVDLKTTQDCSWSEFRRSVEKFRYDVQFAQYSHGTQMITGAAPEHKVWLAVEKTPPYEVRVHEVGPLYEATGDHEYRQCLNAIKSCVEAGSFPQGQLDVELAQPSSWFLQHYEFKGVIHGN